MLPCRFSIYLFYKAKCCNFDWNVPIGSISCSLFGGPQLTHPFNQLLYQTTWVWWCWWSTEHVKAGSVPENITHFCSLGIKSIADLPRVWLWIHQSNEKWWIHALVRKVSVLSSAELSSLMSYLNRQLPAHNYLNNEPPARAA